MQIVSKPHRVYVADIIATADRSDIAPHVKDGYIMMFIYMPGCFPEEFRDYIPQIITPILKVLYSGSDADRTGTSNVPSSGCYWKRVQRSFVVSSIGDKILR